MPKALCLVGTVVAVLLLLVFGFDLALRFPFRRVSLTMDIGLVLCSLGLGVYELDHTERAEVRGRCVRGIGLSRIGFMATDEPPETGREPLSRPKRKRLEKVFEVAGKKAAAAAAPNDFDYVTELLTQCVTGDPGNAIYVRAYIENLQKKYGNNKKGGPLAQFKERGARSALKKALAQEQWDEVIQHGLKVLTVNPWDGRR